MPKTIPDKETAFYEDTLANVNATLREIHYMSESMRGDPIALEYLLRIAQRQRRIREIVISRRDDRRNGKR